MHNNNVQSIFSYLNSIPRENYSDKILLFKSDLPQDFKISIDYPEEYWNMIINNKLQNSNTFLLDDIKKLNEIGKDLLDKSDESIILFIFDLKVIFKLYSYEFLDEILLNCDGYQKLSNILTMTSVNEETKIFLLRFLFDLFDKNVLDCTFFSKSIFCSANYVYHIELKNMFDDRIKMIAELSLGLISKLFIMYPQNDLLSLIVYDAYSIDTKTASYLISNINQSVLKTIFNDPYFNIENYKKEISDLFKALLFSMGITTDNVLAWKKAVLDNIHIYSGILLAKLGNDIEKFNSLIMYTFSTNEISSWTNIVVNETI